MSTSSHSPSQIWSGLEPRRFFEKEIEAPHMKYWEKYLNLASLELRDYVLIWDYLEGLKIKSKSEVETTEAPEYIFLLQNWSDFLSQVNTEQPTHFKAANKTDLVRGILEAAHDYVLTQADKINQFATELEQQIALRQAEKLKQAEQN